MSGPDDATVPFTIRPATPADRPDRLPDRYQLRDMIGSGGMGKVYRAHDATLGRDVAVKVIDHAPGGTGASQSRDRFVREARAAARLAHPNIVAVHDADPEAGWLVMDLVEGESLKDIMQRGAMAAKPARAIAEQVLAALDAAHASGVIHRDIKPSNIIVDARGKVTLVDFGVARLVDAEVTRTGESLGTPAYMAPEQLRGGKVDERTDLYGLAATLYEVVSGERMVAFETPSPASLAKVRQACGKEHGLAQLIVRCLQAAPEQRVASARDAIALLSQKRGRGLFVGVIAALALVGAGAFALSRVMDTKPAGDEARKRELFTMSQSGDHQKAEVLWREYVQKQPDDPDGWTMLLLTTWWSQGRLGEAVPEIERMRPHQADMLRGIVMIALRQEAHAIAFLEDAQKRHPNRVEIEYALGEARWHGQQIERGVQTLEHAYTMDPRWQMALHHVIEYRLSRGEPAPLKQFVDKLRAFDPGRAATLDCEILIAERKYAEALASARASLVRITDDNDLYACAMQAQVLAGDLDGAAQMAKQAAARAPIDLSEWGVRTIAAEVALYRGKLADYHAVLHEMAARQRKIVMALWRPTPDLAEPLQSSDNPRGQPIVPASQNLIEHALGRDPVEIYQYAFEAELRAYGRGLSARLRGDDVAAAAEFRQAMTAPAKGEIRMLAAHHLARSLVAQGDMAGAKTACDEVIRPYQYQAYRAALLPDCVLWSEDPAQWRQLVEQWTGEFQHPSIVEMKRRLATSP